MAENQDPDAIVIRQDVYNRRAALRRKDLAGYTATGSLIKKSDDQEILYVALWEEDEPDRLQALVFCHPQMIKMMERFREVMYLDVTYNTNKYKLPFFQSNSMTFWLELLTVLCPC